MAYVDSAIPKSPIIPAFLPGAVMKTRYESSRLGARCPPRCDSAIAIASPRNPALQNCHTAPTVTPTGRFTVPRVPHHLAPIGGPGIYWTPILAPPRRRQTGLPLSRE